MQSSGDPLTKQSGEHQLLQRPVRIALVGCGYWGPKVVRAASSLATAEISAVVDRDLDLAASVQRQYRPPGRPPR